MKKKNSIKLLPTCLLLLLLGNLMLPGQPSLGQPMLGQPALEQSAEGQQAALDSLQQTAGWQQRSFSPEALQQLQEDEALLYPVTVKEEGWWSRLKEWFFGKLSEALGGASSSGLLNLIIYLFCLGAGIFLILRFLDIDLTSMIRQRARPVSIGVAEGITENIHALNFEQEIQLAVQQQAYRRAVRLVYLASLKQLSDAGVVRWEPGKTHRQYQLELKDPSFKQQFNSLGYFFEYAWYGDFPVDETLYRRVEDEYRLFCKKVEAIA